MHKSTRPLQSTHLFLLLCISRSFITSVPIALLTHLPMLALIVPVVHRANHQGQVGTMMILDLTLLPLNQIIPHLRRGLPGR